MTIYERLAAINKQANLQADYEKTLELLRSLKSGEVHLDQVQMLADGWRLDTTQPEAKPDMKADEPKP